MDQSKDETCSSSSIAQLLSIGNQVIDVNDLVIMKNQQIVTSSLVVAEKFGKEHRSVLKAIDDLKEGVAQKYADLFWEDQYIHPQNKQPYRMIYMNRDGFTILAMGFNGKRAIQFKLQYIDAFNQMETALKHRLPTTFSEALRLAADLEEKNEILQTENQLQAQLIAEYEPKITYLDKILQSRQTLTVTQIAADYGISAIQLNRILSDERVQRKVNSQWILFRKYMNKGYTKSETVNIERHGLPDVTMQTKWTQKGRLFVHELLAKRGIHAVMDLEMEDGL